MDLEKVPQRIEGIQRELRDEGFSAALVGTTYPDPTCSCGRTDCTGKIGISFNGPKPAMLQIIQQLLVATLTPDELATYARNMLEYAYNLKSPAEAPLHRMRFRGGSRN